MVKMLYTDVESVLKVNGGLCTPFKVGRGVRQGCPLSGMLYCNSHRTIITTDKSKFDWFKYTWF